MRRRLTLIVAAGALLVVGSVGFATQAIAGRSNDDAWANGDSLTAAARRDGAQHAQANGRKDAGTSSAKKGEQGSKSAAKTDTKGTKTSNDPSKGAAKSGTTSGAAAGSAATSKATPAPAAKPAAPAPAPAAPAANGITHSNIVTTIFWVGEGATSDNDFITNSMSAWDESWQANYGGIDSPTSRSGYRPANFTPRENPFYVALPYNDFTDSGVRKANAKSCPNVAATSTSWCKNSWIKITKGAKTVYAQWQDVGPMLEDDTDYVFGTAQPKNTWGAKAGLDVSPAVRDYLGLGDVDRTSWTFVSASSVPAGPWRDIVTTNPGVSN